VKKRAVKIAQKLGATKKSGTRNHNAEIDGS